MSAGEEFSDDEMRHNALNDPGLFLDLEDDDDDDVVLSHALSLPNTLMQQESSSGRVSTQPPPPPLQEQQQQQPSSTTSRLSSAGVPKLDVTALGDVSPSPAAQLQQGFGTPGMTDTPMVYSRDGAGDHLSVVFGGPSSLASSPHNATTSPNHSTFNVYSNIIYPPLCARKLNFREFLNQKAVPPQIESEESTGIFVGQLPSSYSEDDIEALLKAIGSEHGQTVQVRDVKSHNRDRTCAFIMINASALNAVLDFSKRALCDINCVWVVDHSQATQLPVYINNLPRDQLRGVPKAALVLEKLTPQSKPRHSMHGAQGGIANGLSPVSYSSMPPNLISPMNALTQQMYMQQQQQQQQHLQQQQQQQQQQQMAGGNIGRGSGMMQGVGFVDASGMQATSPFSGSAFLPSSPGGNGLPQFFNPNAFQSGTPSNTLFQSSNVAPSPTSVYAMQMGNNGGIANIEAANQMMIAASRSRTNSQSHQLNMAPLSPPNAPTDGLGAVPKAVTLSAALQQEHCSCGRMLYLSQYPRPGTCAKCNSTIAAGVVSYWCPNGHIAVCVDCAVQTNGAGDAGAGANNRFMPPQSELMPH